jgi:hypothetical protein
MRNFGNTINMMSTKIADDRLTILLTSFLRENRLLNKDDKSDKMEGSIVGSHFKECKMQQISSHVSVFQTFRAIGPKENLR